MVKIKLCGMMSEDDVRAALKLKPDFIGVILSPGFRRYVEPVEVKRWRPIIEETSTKLVGVFVDEKPELIISLLYEGVIDIAQLHGNEPDDVITQIQAETKKPVIKAFKIESGDDIKRAKESPADCVLLDAGTGEGKSFDHGLIRDVSRDIFLAGGLDPLNVREAIETVEPYAVDVSSGIETDGVKDPERMLSFVNAARSMK